MNAKNVVIVIALAVMASLSAIAAEPQYSETNLAYMSATELLAKFKTCEIKPSEVLEAQISRVKRLNGWYTDRVHEASAKISSK